MTSLLLCKFNMTKIEEFIKRNKKRNAHLYANEAVEGYDYIVCPISKERLSMIKDNYITKILGMTVEEYPKCQRTCVKRTENIKHGLQKIDDITGLTKYEKSQVKARHKLKQVDETGLSGYKRKGQQTRATHMSRVDEFGRNGYRRQADYRLNTVLPNGLTIEQNAHIKQKEKLIANNSTGAGGASKLSKKVLTPILEYLDTNNIKYYFDLNEYGLKDVDSVNYYFYDLTILQFNIAIEYQSIAWHPDPTMNEDEWNNWMPPCGKKKLASVVLQYDYNKARALYKHRGITTYYVWQRTQDVDVKELLCLLKTLNTK
jgi:hypothetical protein